MKIEARIFLLVAAFFVFSAILYSVWSNAAYGHVEWAGSVALLLSAGLLGVSGSFFWFVSRRIDPRPEDRGDGEIAEAAGELGFFSPSSYWPLGLGASAALTAAGLAFVEVWLVLIGAAAILFNVGGLVFEYYTGGRRPIPR